MQSEIYEPIPESGSAKYDIYDWVEAAVFAIVCLILVFTFVGRNISVNGSSMEPTLQNGDRLITSRMFYTPQYGDIIVVTKPNERHEPLIKRVIATEGQTINIDVDEGIVAVDGVIYDEPYILEKTYTKFDLEFPLTVPKGHVFAMGDNRNDSWDSRASQVGMIDERYILGRVVYRVVPFNNHGKPDDYWKKQNG